MGGSITLPLSYKQMESPMKKIVLLFTIVCASQLYGMDPTSSFTKVSEDRSLYELQRTGPQNISDLPKDVHNEIIKTALATSPDLLRTIEAINVASALRGVRYDNLKDFTRLVHILSNKFNALDASMIDWFLGYHMPGVALTADEYATLAHDLIDAIEKGQVDTAASLIEQGADVNYSFFSEDYGYTSALIIAVRKNDTEIVKLLLNAGANPHHTDKYTRKTALDYAQEKGSQEIVKLLTDAMKEYPPSH
jgi:hypothetical protein